MMIVDTMIVDDSWCPGSWCYPWANPRRCAYIYIYINLKHNICVIIVESISCCYLLQALCQPSTLHLFFFQNFLSVWLVLWLPFSHRTWKWRWRSGPWFKPLAMTSALAMGRLATGWQRWTFHDVFCSKRWGIATKRGFMFQVPI